MEYDRILIEQSIAKQYGVLPSDQGDLHYSDWSKMVSGLMDDTPLGRVVMIRSEKDADRIKTFSPEQKRMQAEWKKFRAENAKKVDAKSYSAQMRALENMFATLYGGGKQ